VVRKERNLYGPGVVHDGGVPHGSIERIKMSTRGVSHPDLRANPNARIHVRQDQITHMHRLSKYQNTV
jgi:hypothetical protein